MPPNNTNPRKSTDQVEIPLSLEEKHLLKCYSIKETSVAKIPTNIGIGQSKFQTSVKKEGKEVEKPRKNQSVCSLLDELLYDIYSKMEIKRRTSATTCDLSWQDSDNSRCSRNKVRCMQYWKSKDLDSLKAEKTRLENLIADEGNNLIKHLKRKNFLLLKRENYYDVITAYLQAISTKTREDTKMKFSLTPGAETGFSQWLDAMKMVAQLPGGMPSEFRTKLWLQLSEKHLHDQNVDWEKAEAVLFNEWMNPDDEELGVQIVKDLHRTGCSLFCGEQEHNQALLKRVLLAYARWNKNVGYCQGFNMLAALILQVMDKNESNAVKVMIYLIEGVLPESYFANNLRGLSVDMAVFRDLLRIRLPKLSKHLEALQHDTNAGEGTSYEPPLTNVFTMQWFLTLFSNCLPQQTVLRVWDLVFLYGNEVLLRTALVIWGILQDRVITVESADEFYSIMGVVTREMLEFGLMDANALVKMIAMVDPFPNELQELREKYLYNISPWTQSVQSAAKKGIRLFYSDPDDQDDTEDEDKIALATAYGVFRRRESSSKELQISGPTLDISVLKQQYAKLRQRQRQAHVIITAACSSNLAGNLSTGTSVSMNHLLMGKSALINKGRRIGPPEGSIPPPKNNKGKEKEGNSPKIVISGETFHWKDADKKKTSKVKSESKQKSNVKEIDLDGNNKFKMEKEESKLKTNHDRMEGVSEESVEDSLREKEKNSDSSSSSTSTELCDEEFHRYTDSDDAQSDASAYTSSKSHRSPKSPLTIFNNSKSSNNSGCDKDNFQEIKTLAINLVNEIEEKVNYSKKLNQTLSHCKKENKNLDDNTSLLDTVLQCSSDNILKPEPKVPICEFVFNDKLAEERKSDNKESESGKLRRKSDLGLSVIRENLQMLSKFSQKNTEKAKTKSFEFQEGKADDLIWFDEKKVLTNEIKPVDLPITIETEVQNNTKTEVQRPVRATNNLFVEKAISPIVEKSLKATKVNKEVNTELTFGVDEVEISTKQSKPQTEEEFKFKLVNPEEISVPTSSRKSREMIFREKDEIKQKLETSKSDWELKMKKIAELESTTRETLNEIQSKSNHRKSLHRSLDRNTKRTYVEEEFQLRSPEKSFYPTISLDREEETSQRKKKISALSFDEITSRTEKLLGKSDFNQTPDKTYKHTFPDFDTWKSKNFNLKYRQSDAEKLEENTEKAPPPLYEFFSSPTSPEYRTSSNIRYRNFLCPKNSEKKYEEDLIKVTETETKTKVELFDKKSSPEKTLELDLELSYPKSNFNPFPKRNLSKPKELGVKLGLYPTSPTGPQSKKS